IIKGGSLLDGNPGSVLRGKSHIYLSDERDGHLADLMPRFAAETILSALRCGVISPEELVEHTPQNELFVVL
ncbi:hypothetical protein, partial [Falsigemmobacter intermedius]|uniref:hypothetical protein n=1 Tax=Falsigemmobacter intermedius TaxID=1553448 RepID=UPI0019D41364